MSARRRAVLVFVLVATPVVVGLGGVGWAVGPPADPTVAKAVAETGPDGPSPDATSVMETARLAALAEFAGALERARDAETLRIWAAVVVLAEMRAARDAVWDRMAQCETGGNWSMRGSSYSGGVGFANSTWDAFGGREFAPNAGLASREEQIVVAERVRARHGYGAWGCADSIGL